MSSLTTSILIADTGFSVGGTLGAIYIGATIAAVFYGITLLQTAVYYKLNPNDPWIFRYTVALLWYVTGSHQTAPSNATICRVLDTLHVAFSTHALYYYLIDSFGNYVFLLRIIWSFPLQLVFNMIIATGVQALYAIRIWKLGRHFHVVLPWFIFFAVAATFGTGLYVIYDTYRISSILDISTIRTSIYSVFSTMVGADFAITARPKQSWD
ncbi:uncharacterized protein BT62DRAFT_330189 [Guyanagaster necrorhizus]|uniref:Uncharacterized protein n=1 Tax=Guyanagaster necrorhizus TaxID=856835 RepID=A0A9P8APX1_9AGAR|nr:uncharacterized protein BT62DRAFT_330189 [Guyanagaster necrorhizus MCA 3950]KAG7443420.1 hypothetical protein BT62DRAFT_330189 [Guyanagaster necrorhizus MCA 3950]